MKKRTKRLGRRPQSLAGTGLSLNERGIYDWRYTDSRTGRRLKRSTGERTLERALRRAAQFDEKRAREEAGLAVHDNWRVELRPLVKEWETWQDGTVLDSTIASRSSQVLRALDAFGLRVAADLDHVARIVDRVKKLLKEGMKPVTLRRGYQNPLRLFSAWLATDKRYLDRDPLALWKPIKEGPKKPVRRAFLPDEVARAFLALDRLDAHHGRTSPQRVPFLLMLVTAPRPGALLSRTASELDRRRARLDFGPDVGKKRKGAGGLDEATLADVMTYVGKRAGEEALVLSPTGVACTKEVFLDVWREAFGLGIVDELWPADEPRTLDLAILVNRCLREGVIAVSKGGKTKRVEGQAHLAEVALAKRVEGLVERLRDDWKERMTGIDVTAFRKTHRTWAEAVGVPPVLIDKQLGHTERGDATSLDVLRQIVGSATGVRFYLDRASPLLEAARSATAVRGLLDQALERVSRQESSVLVVPALVPTSAAGA